MWLGQAILDRRAFLYGELTLRILNSKASAIKRS